MTQGGTVQACRCAAWGAHICNDVNISERSDEDAVQLTYHFTRMSKTYVHSTVEEKLFKTVQ